MNLNHEVDFLFPIPVYKAKNILEENEKSLLLKTINDQIPLISKNTSWNCNTLHSLGKFDLQKCFIFSNINEKVKQHVNQFARLFDSNHEYEIKESWFNISEKTSFQEYHIHKNSIFSAVYYLSSPIGSGEFIIQNPNDRLDMLSLEYNQVNKFNASYHYYKPIENSLLIFRSYLYHMVKHGTNQKNRVSLSYNFS